MVHQVHACTLEIVAELAGARVAFNHRMRTPRPLCAAIFNLRVARVRAALTQPGDLPEIDATLGALVRGGAHDTWLARRAGLSSALLELLWTAVALEADPLLLPRAV